MRPDLLAEGDGLILQQSLGDRPKLHMTLASGHLSFDLLSVFFHFLVQVLAVNTYAKRADIYYREMADLSRSIDSQEKQTQRLRKKLRAQSEC